MHLSRVISQSVQNNTDIGTSVGESFANISEAIGGIAFPTMANIACEQGLMPPYIGSIIVVVNVTV